MSPPRILLTIFVAACLVGGGGVLYLDIGNKPMVYYSIKEGFNYEYAITFALMGAAYFGPFLFFVALMLYGIGYVFAVAIQILIRGR